MSEKKTFNYPDSVESITVDFSQLHVEALKAFEQSHEDLHNLVQNNASAKAVKAARVLAKKSSRELSLAREKLANENFMKQLETTRGPSYF
jgi:hypothetical protein